MTDSLKQLELIESDLEYFKQLEDFWNEHHPEPEPKPFDYGASAMVFYGPKPSIATLKYRLSFIRNDVYVKLDAVYIKMNNLIKKQQTLINKLKKKK